jgi:hypothetical protein
LVEHSAEEIGAGGELGDAGSYMGRAELRGTAQLGDELGIDWMDRWI